MPSVSRPTKPLAKVNVLPQQDGTIVVEPCLMPNPAYLVGEGNSRAALALDGSRSMMAAYGLPFGTNYVQVIGRKLGELLADLVKTGKTSMLYWTTTRDGALETIGEFDVAGCQKADISGPKKWGPSTLFLPVLKHVVETVAADAQWTMAVVITDGLIDDEQACMDYCMQVGRTIAGTGKVIKFILVGIGEEVAKEQLVRFDDMFEGTELEGRVDLFSTGLAEDIRNEEDILNVLFSELMEQDKPVAASGVVSDAGGKEVARWPNDQMPDGLPGKFRFVLPRGSRSFTIRTPDVEVTQDISEVVSA